MERLAGKIILLWGWPRALTAFAAGALASLAQAPFDFPAAVFLAFPVLVWLLDGAVPALGGGFWRRILPGFWTGWAFGFGYFLAGLWWIGNALLVEADLFAWALPLAVVGLPAFLALFYGLAAGIARLLWSDGLGRIAALAFGFGVAEWLRATVLTGFPWNAVGYATMPVPMLMQSLGIVGMVGMNVLTVFAAALPAMFAQRGKGARTLVLLALLLAAHAGSGAWRLSTAPEPSGDALAVRIVQPSILQSQKWDRNERDRTFRAHLDLTMSPPAEGAQPADAIIWPETSVPFLFGDRPDALAAIGGALEEDQRLLAGIVRRDTVTTDGPPRYFNSIVAINGAGEIVDAFDKVHLVPFGEYLPMDGFLRALGLRQLAQNVGGFSAGTRRRPIEIAPGVEALPFICYEIIFPGSATPTQDADLLLNVTNDAWFGRTPGPYQHFRQAQYRAVEARLPMVRAANNGLSAVVDGYGRIIDGLALDAVGVLDVAVPLGRVRPFGSPFAPQHAGFALLVLSAIGAAAGKRRISDRVN